jgi:hypothetical protein
VILVYAYSKFFLSPFLKKIKFCLTFSKEIFSKSDHIRPHGLKKDENSLHPTFQKSLAVGLNLKIYHLNIQGILGPQKVIIRVV